MTRTLRCLFLTVDIGFLGYWLSTVLHLIPAEYLYRDYNDRVLVAWNWSFLPLDLLISATGLTALWLHSKGRDTWRTLALLSLAFTSASGLQAIAFWSFRREFDLLWWLPNLFLLIYPGYYLFTLTVARGTSQSE